MSTVIYNTSSSMPSTVHTDDGEKLLVFRATALCNDSDLDPGFHDTDQVRARRAGLWRSIEAVSRAWKRRATGPEYMTVVHDDGKLREGAPVWTHSKTAQVPTAGWYEHSMDFLSLAGFLKQLSPKKWGLASERKFERVEIIKGTRRKMTVREYVWDGSLRSEYLWPNGEVKV